MTVTFLLGRVLFPLGRDPVGLKLVDPVVGIANPFFGIGRMALGVGDLVGDVLHSLDKIVHCGWRKRQLPDPVP
ncbi:MAG: hypothetical protein WB760_31270 [Xanthobacteraceae bacterium]